MKNSIVFSLFIALSCHTIKAQYTKLFDFDSTKGNYPAASLISDGTFLYGTTKRGGANNYGVIFKIQLDGTGYSKLHDFAGIDGRTPFGSLFFDSTFLYGTTIYGGISDSGTIFKIKPDGTGYSKLHDFTVTTNGRGPLGSLISDGTFLYGMAGGGGTNRAGIIFKIKPDGTDYSKLFDFGASANGWYPQGSLFSDGTFLYGTTAVSGLVDGGPGAIFKIQPDGTGYEVLFEFSSPFNVNGRSPWGTLISDGTFLYGTTLDGGTTDWGVIFKIRPDGTDYSKVHDFDSTNGSRPAEALLFDGMFLYGMTGAGGAYNTGVLFKIKPDGTGYSKLHDFEGFMPFGPFGPLVGPQGTLISDGASLYGMTVTDGINHSGTIFKYGLATGIATHHPATGLNVYPNPTTGMFTIEIDGTQRTWGEVEIYNIIGEKIYQTTISENSFNINLNLTDGVYYVHVITEQGTVSQKIIVRH